MFKLPKDCLDLGLTHVDLYKKSRLLGAYKSQVPTTSLIEPMHASVLRRASLQPANIDYNSAAVSRRLARHQEVAQSVRLFVPILYRSLPASSRT
jgi:hypothetical protein